MEPCNAIPKKHFVSEEENNCQREINLTPQDRIGNIDWCKWWYECKFWSVKGASCHSAFMGNYPTISHTILALYTF